jgi:membrane-bound lytic murein transglycosylase F
MMLTMDTAAFLRVTDREDPVQSIFGGARYFRQLLDQLPPEIQEPERTWMALAAYNMGIGHLLDAREVTRRTGGDPNRWLDVRNALPLLTQAKWNRTLKYGYARGYEAITYVGNVRTYYDMLIWMLGDQMGAPQGEVEPPLEIPDVQPEDVTPLNITSPVL